MGRPTVELELNTAHARDLDAGGVFVPGCGLQITEECDLLVRAAAGEMPLVARVVFVDPAGRGAGLEVVGFNPDLRQRIADLAAAPAPTPEPAPLQLDLDPLPADPPFDPEATQPISLEEMDDADPDDPRSGDTIEDDGTGDDDGDGDTEDDAAARARAPMLHERLRGLTLVQQLKVAHTGEMQERILLERIYGKTVWEALLRNPRLTGQEVARIARMGALPRTLLETIVSNGGWLQIPEVRRALLTHPRLGVDQITRILRLLPKHELKLATAQTAYSLAVREHARRLLRG